MKINLKSISLLIMAAVISVSIAACSIGSSDSTNAAQAAASSEASAQGQSSQNLNNNQPIPEFKYSQARQTLINAETIEANGENTTTFGFSNDGKVVWQCSSIGMPVPADAQLSNPEQLLPNPSGANSSSVPDYYNLPQEEPFGYYTGPTTGTYTLCVGPHAAQYLQYWEGYTDAVSGPASYVNGQVVLQGAPVPIKAVPVHS